MEQDPPQTVDPQTSTWVRGIVGGLVGLLAGGFLGCIGSVMLALKFVDTPDDAGLWLLVAPVLLALCGLTVGLGITLSDLWKRRSTKIAGAAFLGGAAACVACFVFMGPGLVVLLVLFVGAGFAGALAVRATRFEEIDP